ncbi:ABC-2 type transporter [Kordia sp. SMS9]|uniref:ABC transporter permease n=1 Tax=Kordia sp. SMS9 TaxID=2282170 RepID=UPI000E0DA430|nr:ABC transporter permease [Kordia sp. SMS9]AXG71354.1 ABC-2 type transporter [Kordia sp. SMS9]
MNEKVKDSDDWLFVISPKSNLFDLKLKEIWRYRDLLMQFVVRDIVTLYKQTVLGPIWHILQPLLTSVIFTIVFNGIADIKTGNVNAFLFNLAGITIWNYFAECLKATSDTFKKNESIFGKVYFPRVITPLSITISNLVKFSIQLLIFTVFYIFFYFQGDAGSISVAIFSVPIVVVTMGLLGLGFGMIISSMVTKYRDLVFLIQFGIQLLMYISAVMYPIAITVERLPSYISWIVNYNPLARVVESFRFMVFSEGKFSLTHIIITFVIAIIIFFIGLLIFNKTERNFIDTI